GCGDQRLYVRRAASARLEQQTDGHSWRIELRQDIAQPAGADVSGHLIAESARDPQTDKSSIDRSFNAVGQQPRLAADRPTAQLCESPCAIEGETIESN